MYICLREQRCSLRSLRSLEFEPRSEAPCRSLHPRVRLRYSAALSALSIPSSVLPSIDRDPPALLALDLNVAHLNVAERGNIESACQRESLPEAQPGEEPE